MIFFPPAFSRRKSRCAGEPRACTWKTGIVAGMTWSLIVCVCACVCVCV